MIGAFIISPNGLGHTKRVLGWLPYLLEAFPTLELHLALADWQRVRLAAPWEHNPRVHFATGYTEGAVRWHRDAADYAGQDLLAWRNRLQQWPMLRQADFVVSDNMVEVLALRPDTLLMGSFLWGSVVQAAFPTQLNLRQYAEEEHRLLTEYRPPLLCVDDLVMPAAVARTQAVRLPWMTTAYERPATNASSVPRIGFLGGATPSIQSALLNQAKALAQEGAWEVYVPERQWEAGNGVHAFDFSEDAWAQLDAVVCRPGVGTLTDAVRYRVPILAIEEPENAEMQYNGQQIEALGLGQVLPLAQLPALAQRLHSWETPSGRTPIQTALAARPLGGYAAATEWLKGHLRK